ncbi:hypothetical protein AAG570_000628 [Ranatra chinensis]|uniref:Uncharacterized protein n=1 Tax=Ranatra chinensis TaxID=642074 RepID=A0ABD0ZEI4_9HEMI
MGGAVSAGVDHDDLIDKLMGADYIKTPAVELVFRAVDRAFYFLPDSLDSAYKDLAWKKGNIHLSAPCIYGEVMESLELNSGLSFLNIGSGTGYLSTMAGLILGPYGVNHGIELHGDVIEYAYIKLNEFKRTSPALDCYEFCDPVFIKGNSLCLSSATRQYDRVYCGAACPENHENYMKNLLKVGGILVMPINDQLMQIIRKTETTWESRAVLPVSFSTLQLPSPEETNNSVTLPDIQPLLLQEVCRAAVRKILRKKAQEEHPGILVVRKRRIHPPKRSRKIVPNVIIPILESSEDEGAPADFPRLLLSGGIGIRPVAGRRLGSVLDLARTLTTIHDMDEGADSSAVEEEEEDEEDEDEESADNSGRGASLAERRSKVPKREKFDSGVVTDMDNGGTHGEMNGFFTESDISSEEEDEDDANDDDEDMAKRSIHSVPQQPPIQEEKHVVLYSVVMREKIKTLPLPPSLKSYLNYYRDF